MRFNSRQGKSNKLSMTARAEMDLKGIRPIDLLLEVYTTAMQAYKSGRGLTDKGDSGPGYLMTAGKAAADLMKYYAPTMTAVAVQIQGEGEESPKTALDAAKIVKEDPFFKHAKLIADKALMNPEEKVMDPILVSGEGNK